MVSLIAASSAHLMVSLRQFPILLVISPPIRQHPLRLRQQEVKLKKKNQFLFEFSDCCGCVGVVRMCKRWEAEGDEALELEVLEFMNNSKNPRLFPSKRELIEGGRKDLVEAIMKRGGWMSMGWQENVDRVKNVDEFDRNLKFSFGKDGKNSYLEGRSCVPTAASSSNQSIELAAEESGIEGILNRLEQQRNLNFGVKLVKNGSGSNVSEEQKARTSTDVENSCYPETSGNATLSDDGRKLHDKGSNKAYLYASSSSCKGDSWRTWSIQRAGISDTEFEAAEIDFGRDTNGSTMPITVGSINADTSYVNEVLDNIDDSSSLGQEIAQTNVKSRLQQLQWELSNTLLVLRSHSGGLSTKDKENLFEDLRQLSDASEFQENELMHAQDKLRSLRAKLAVLEGKMALAIIESQKMLDEKQKRIDNAHRALQFLRTTSIVWPNPGSEVLLAGSFDGWATMRKMERSNNGVFSLSLKLYPGKYEIKFIVDGSWKVDPLRPIVENNGYENNLLIVG